MMTSEYDFQMMGILAERVSENSLTHLKIRVIHCAYTWWRHRLLSETISRAPN